MLNIVSTDKFREANKKTTVCVLLLARPGLVNSKIFQFNCEADKKLKECLYGDIPEEYITK